MDASQTRGAKIDVDENNIHMMNGVPGSASAHCMVEPDGRFWTARRTCESEPIARRSSPERLTDTGATTTVKVQMTTCDLLLEIGPPGGRALTR